LEGLAQEDFLKVHVDYRTESRLSPGAISDFMNISDLHC